MDRQQIKEFALCKADPAYFIENYCLIQHPHKGLVPFRLYDFQLDILKSFVNDTFVITNKARQCLPKETMVDTPNGPKAIELFKRGDKVFSYSNGVEIDIVSDCWKSGIRECLKIKLKDSRNVEVGENHPLYVIDKGWVQAKNLVVGDVIFSKNESDSSIIKITRLGKKECFDISVEKNENYFIDGLLVHNTGLSTLSSCYALWLALFHKRKTIIIISIKDDDAKDFLKKIKTAYYNLPDWMADEPVQDNVHVLELTSGSLITSVASGSNASRGRTPSLLIIDECVAGDTKVKIRNKKTKETIEITMQELWKKTEKNYIQM